MPRRKESRAAMLRRLKNQRRRAGIGEFRKKSRTTRRKSSRGRQSTMAKRKRSSTRRKTITSGLGQPLTAGVAYGIAQPFVSQFLSKFGISTQDEFMQIILALGIKNFTRNKYATAYANAAIIVNVAALARTYSSGFKLGGSTSSSGGMSGVKVLN